MLPCSDNAISNGIQGIEEGIIDVHSQLVVRGQVPMLLQPRSDQQLRVQLLHLDATSDGLDTTEFRAAQVDGARWVVVCVASMAREMRWCAKRHRLIKSPRRRSGRAGPVI